MPDRAIIRVTVEADGGAREDAYREAARLAGQVDSVIAGRVAATDRVQVTSLVVHPKTRWRKGESVRTGWRASRTSVAEVVDFSVLGDLLAELAAAGGAVDGPTWELDLTNPVHGRARELAGADARRRADAYAAALGLRVVGVAWVAEPGLRGPEAPTYMPMMTRSAFAGDAGADQAEVIDVTPDELTIDASVDVAFTYAAV
ncbi:MAG: uncharacterized protein QOE93_1304 [Actinomycetota bacterium]|jgi:uncharacterized protein YggE|nr:uncharacterized protein [Actinomycetota bacterium]